MTPYKRMEFKVEFGEASRLSTDAQYGERAETSPWHRLKLLQPQCGFGQLGLCCRSCAMGPCRASFFAEGPRRGVCGASPDLMAARWLVRVAASAASIRLERLREEGAVQGSSLPQPYPLIVPGEAAGLLDADKPPYTLFGSKLYSTLRSSGLLPAGPRVELVRALSSAAMGSASDARVVALEALKLSLSDTWITSTLLAAATEAFTEPRSVEPLQAEGLVVLAACLDDYSMERLVKALESLGSPYHIVELACEWRGSHPVVADLASQELLAYSGMISAVAYQWPCVAPAALEAFKKTGAVLVDAREDLGTIVGKLQAAEKRRASCGSTATRYSLASLYAATDGLSMVAEAIEEGSVKGIVLLGGCGNPKQIHGSSAELVAALAKNDVLVLSYGCTAHQLAEKGLLSRASVGLAGDGLRRLCSRAGIPPVIHIATCTTYAQALQAGRIVSEQLGMGVNDAPAALLAPEASGERILSGLLAAAASGLLAGTAVLPGYYGSHSLRRLLGEELGSMTGGRLLYTPDPGGLLDAVLEWMRERRRKA